MSKILGIYFFGELQDMGIHFQRENHTHYIQCIKYGVRKCGTH